MKKLIFSIAMLSLAYLPVSAQSTATPTETKKEAATGTRVNKAEPKSLPAPALKPATSSQVQTPVKPPQSNADLKPATQPQASPTKKDGTPDRRLKVSKKMKNDGSQDLRYKESKENNIRKSK